MIKNYEGKLFLLIAFLLSSSPLQLQAMEDEKNTDEISQISTSKKLKLKDQLLENGVIVRVWSATQNLGQSVGHVSLHTKLDYISFWPNKDNGGYFMKDLSEDLLAMKKDPEFTIFLPHKTSNSLLGINKNFIFLGELLQEKNLKWTMLGNQKLKKLLTRDYYQQGASFSKNLTEKDKEIWDVYEKWEFNCASLVLNLLQNNKYVKKYYDGLEILNVSVAPDRVASLCSMEFLYNFFQTRSKNEIFYKLEPQVTNKGEKFIHSDLELFGKLNYKSINEDIIANENLLDDVINEIKSQKEKGVVHNLTNVLINNGIVEHFGPFFSSFLKGIKINKMYRKMNSSLLYYADIFNSEIYCTKIYNNIRNFEKVFKTDRFRELKTHF